MNENEFAVSYALSKMVPDMARGFSISTNYGELWIEPKDAQPFVEQMEALLEKRLAEVRAEG